MSEGYAVHGRPGTGREGDRRGAGVVLVLIVAFLAIAITKPWGAPGASTTSASRTPSTVPEASSTSSGPPPGPAATSAAAPLPVAFTTPVPPPAAASWAGLRWQRLAPDEPLRLVTSILRWRGGFVAIGSEDGNPATPAWTSADGAHWRPLIFGTATTFWPGLALLRVAEVRATLVALTEAEAYCGAPCVPTYILPVFAWTSADGRRWTPHLLSPEWLASGPPGRAPLVAAGPAGLLVASRGTTARLAFSTDGTHWRVLPAGAFPGRFAIDDLQGTRTGYVAAGRWTSAATKAGAAVLWSADGRHWSTAPTLLPRAPGSALASSVTAMVAGRDGLIAVGRNPVSPETTLWWNSVDGRAWTAFPTYPPLGTACSPEGCRAQPDGSLVGDGQRIVALRAGSPGEGWVSSDGRSWRRLAMTGEVPAVQATQAVLLPGGVLLRDGSAAWFGAAVVR